MNKLLSGKVKLDELKNFLSEQIWVRWKKLSKKF